MISYIKSELIKLKNSLGIWSTLLFALAVVIMEILIFKSKSNITLEIRENIHISLMLIVLMLNTLILTNQAFKSEKEAGNFQNMLTFKNCYRLWFSKLFSLFFLLYKTVQRWSLYQLHRHKGIFEGCVYFLQSDLKHKFDRNPQKKPYSLRAF